MRASEWIITAAVIAILSSGCSLVMNEGVAYSPALGPGVELYGYPVDMSGDWHANYLRWTPAVVFEISGRYYPIRVRGARELQLFRSPSGYFLPPRDPEWLRVDRRFKLKNLPNDSDYGRAKPLGPGPGTP